MLSVVAAVVLAVWNLIVTGYRAVDGWCGREIEDIKGDAWWANYGLPPPPDDVDEELRAREQ